MKIDRNTAEAAVIGGAIFGGGGGGWIEEGRTLAEAALDMGFSEALPLEAVPPDGLLLTVSAVGSPSAGKGLLRPEDYIRAVELYLERSGQKIQGLISSEIGALGIVNGWIQSAALKIPLIDSPANGRAHPLGLMGSMNLHRAEGFLSQQAAVGRNPSQGERLEEFFSGALEEVSKKVRETAVRAGGMAAVARNAVPAAYVKRNGAPGAIRMAVRAGEVWLKNRMSGAKKVFVELYEHLRVDFIVRGEVVKVKSTVKGGFDTGAVSVQSKSRLYELTFWNEYMTFGIEEARVGTFPDLIMTFDSRTGRPLVSAEIREGQKVVVIVVPGQELILGAPMRDMELLKQVERAVGREILRYRKS